MNLVRRVRTNRLLREASWCRSNMACARSRSCRSKAAGFTSLDEYSMPPDSLGPSDEPPAPVGRGGSLVRSIDCEGVSVRKNDGEG